MDQFLQHMDRVVGPAIRRRQAPPGPPLDRLPESKDADPKVLCLDFCHWVRLAKAHYGLGEDPDAAAALSAIRTAQQQGALVLPATDVNIQELNKAKDRQRRARMASFIVDLSQNLCLRSSQHTWRPQIRHAIASLYLGDSSYSDGREEVLRWGLLDPFCSYPSYGDRPTGTLLEGWMRSPAVSQAVLSEGTPRDVVDIHSSKESVALLAMKAARLGTHLPQERFTAEMQALERELETCIRLALADLGDPTGFHEWLETGRTMFWNSVPNAMVLHTLYRRDDNPEHPSHINDFRDVAFLQSALPYANFVCTEKSWAHLCRAAGLESSLSTRVLSNVADIVELLQL